MCGLRGFNICINQLNKYVLSSCYVPGTVEAHGKQTNKYANKNSALPEMTFFWGNQKQTEVK